MENYAIPGTDENENRHNRYNEILKKLDNGGLRAWGDIQDVRVDIFWLCDQLELSWSMQAMAEAAFELVAEENKALIQHQGC